VQNGTETENVTNRQGEQEESDKDEDEGIE